MGDMETTATPKDRHALQPILVRVPEDLRAALRERATLEERTQTQVIRRALRYYLELPVN
jgi:hypothetical protein